MVAMGLCFIVIKKYRHYFGHTKVVELENLLQQDFTTTAINQKWCTDITYIHTLKEGCPYDNACIESFHSLLKKEEVHLHIYIDSKDAYKSIFEYIESWYNRKRIHSSLNYMTPEAVHNMTTCAA